jgi:small subunit ribosomal protein S1
LEIIIAKQAGFCFGVKRAVDLAEAVDLKSGSVYTLGPIIHNRQVVGRLKERGIHEIKDLPLENGSTVIFRSHGVSPATIELANQRKLDVIDATCPFVKRAQTDAKFLSDAGYQVVVVGDKHHPEVEAIVAWAGGNANVIENRDEAQELPTMDKVGIVAQTTLSPKEFAQIVDIIKAKCADVKICHTICNATQERQSAAEDLAGQVDIMIVVGGKHSANTARLAEICGAAGTPTHHIETAAELKTEWFRSIQRAGITAGASTPDWIIEEVYHTMQDLDFSQAFEASFKEINRGQVVSGTVVQVGRDEVFVDIGYKSEGVIPRNELAVTSDVQPEDVVKVGDIIEVFVLRQEGKDGYPLLSKKRADARKGWDKAEEAVKSGAILNVPVVEVVKGGLVVNLLGVRGFVPASLVERRFISDLSGYLGKELRVRIIEIDRTKNKVVMSQKVVLEEEATKSKELMWSDIEEGQVRQGIVRRLTDYGAFVDIGGVEGLLHVSEMAWERVKDPASIVKVGDTISVMVLKIDKEQNRVSLGLKQTQTDPWVEAVRKYQVGQNYKGKVVRLAKFGAFVSLEPGVDGLIHLSHLGEKRIVKPEDVVSVGEEVTVKVIDINPAERRIGLSIRELEQDKERDQYREYISQQDNANATVGDAIGPSTDEEK